GELSALVEADGLRLLIDLAEYALKFVVQNAAVAGKGAGSGLRGQRTKTVQHLRDVVHAAVADLQGADTVVGVLHALREFGFAAAEAVGDSQARGVVRGRVDAVAGGQLLNGLALESLCGGEVLLS